MALRPVDLCTDCFFLLDCVRVFNTAMVKGNEIYFDRADIARLYLRSWFCVDFFSFVPYGTLLKVGRSRERGSGRGCGACGRPRSRWGLTWRAGRECLLPLMWRIKRKACLLDTTDERNGLLSHRCARCLPARGALGER